MNLGDVLGELVELTRYYSNLSLSPMLQDLEVVCRVFRTLTSPQLGVVAAIFRWRFCRLTDPESFR